MLDLLIKIYAAVVGTLGLILSLYSLWESLGANISVTAHGDDAGLRVRIFNRGRRKVRVDTLRFWYGTTDFKTVLSEVAVDVTLDECAHHDLLIDRTELVHAAQQRSVEPYGRSLLHLDVFLQSRWLRKHGIVEFDESLLSEADRKRSLAPYMAANAFLKIPLLAKPSQSIRYLHK